MPDELLNALKAARSESKRFADLLADAEQAYRDQKPVNRIRHGLVPQSGLTQALSKRFERVLGEPEDDEDLVHFVWVPMSDHTFFDVDPETNTVFLNSIYREAVLYGNRGSSGGAPLVKTLVMLLCKEDMGRQNRVKAHVTKLAIFNELLVEAVRTQW